MQRLTLGNFELIAVSDGIYRLDGGAFFGVIPKVMWSKKVAVDENNYVPTGVNSIVVRTGDHTVLIETGIGNKLPEKLARIYGQPAQLLDNLSAAGIAPEYIDIVINTHLHFDHCGWNTVLRAGQPVATFPKAKYYVQEGEWQYAQRPSERDGVSYMTDNYDPLVASGQMQLLRGGGKTACYISDLIPTSAHLGVNWVMAFDLFPLQTLDSRKRYYAQALPEKWLTMLTHDPNMPWAYVEKDERGKMVARAGAEAA